MTPIEARLIDLRDHTADERDKETLGKAILAVRALDRIRNEDGTSYACNICRYSQQPMDATPCKYCGTGALTRFEFIGREVFE